MMTIRIFALPLVLAVLSSSCATTTAAYSPGDPSGQSDWVLYGRVEAVREMMEQDRGDPARGAVAGAVIGGLLGTAMGGRGFGTFVGATQGAMIGAHASQGGYVGMVFHVHVRFDDGSLRLFVYRDQLPFHPGEYVAWTPQGLVRR